MAIEIIKYWNGIPRHPILQWKKRKLETIKKIVVHQLASPAYPDTHKDIDNNIRYFLRPNHVSNTGCAFIPYHVVIDDDGIIYWTNPWEDISWHCKGYNTESIGIALMGSFDGPGFKGKDGNPTSNQINSLIKILDSFILNLFEFKDIKKSDVFGHCDLDPVNKPACPGTEAMKILTEWKNQI